MNGTINELGSSGIGAIAALVTTLIALKLWTRRPPPLRPPLLTEPSIVLITGAGGGIGREIARTFVKDCNCTHVILVGRTESTLLETKALLLLNESSSLSSSTSASAIATSVSTQRCDITSSADVQLLALHVRDVLDAVGERVGDEGLGDLRHCGGPYSPSHRSSSSLVLVEALAVRLLVPL
ncbi:short chain dehydrogenase, putative [Bodo saltans]|uniref:Short chain dehydrogenase, putative n=1 Tax=Bodo saltans TaxID=75058 RepID=A0A0S4JI49_BODSA|nr:short chain dehydrogenase, putative [Bodo saltans]|eukprot:CUG89818.1 short chain dehydrogenase, putative [Bodo saltans]